MRATCSWRPGVQVSRPDEGGRSSGPQQLLERVWEPSSWASPGAETTSVCIRSRALRSLPLSSPGLRLLLRLELRGGPGWQPHPRALPHPGRGPGRRAGPQPLPAGERHLGLQGGSRGSRSSMRLACPQHWACATWPPPWAAQKAGGWGLGGNLGVKHCPRQQASINSPLT